MTDAAILPSHAAEGDFSIGRVLSRSLALMGRNFLPFSVVMATAAAPILAFDELVDPDSGDTISIVVMTLISLFLAGVLAIVSQAVVVHGSFQDMRRRPVDLLESIKIGLNRFFPILSLAILVMLGMGLGFIFFIIPGLMLMTRWYVAVPACVVERLGPRDSMARSAQLTEGHCWKIFGAIILFHAGSAIVGEVISASLSTVGGAMLALVGSLIWEATSGTFLAIFVVVTYYELRASKEGIDIEQIAAVFD